MTGQSVCRLMGSAALWGLALCGLLLGGPALAQPMLPSEVIGAPWPDRVGRLVEVQGTVWFYDRDEVSWTQAQHNRPLTTGDRLSTDPGSRVELRIGSTTLRLAGDTEVLLRQLDDQAIAVELTQGSLALRATARDVLSQIEISTPEGRFTPLATGHYRIDRRVDSSQASSWRGALQFEGGDSRLSVAAGQRAELWLQGSPPTTHYRWLDVARDDFADWVARDDRGEDRSQSTRYVSTEMTGWEDLDRHGRWQSHPEFGSVWFPTQLRIGWEPYRDGRWQWVSPWGWTWVDAAPWGFAPFHYGRWLRWDGRWAWAPGPRAARPAYAPALVGWTPAPHRPGAPRPPPPSSWVPLTPHDVYRPHRHPMPRIPDHAIPLVPPPRGDRHPPRPPAHAPGTTARVGPDIPGRPAPWSTPTSPLTHGSQAEPSGVNRVPRDAARQAQSPATATPPSISAPAIGPNWQRPHPAPQAPAAVTQPAVAAPTPVPRTSPSAAATAPVLRPLAPVSPQQAPVVRTPSPVATQQLPAAAATVPAPSRAPPAALPPQPMAPPRSGETPRPGAEAPAALLRAAPAPDDEGRKRTPEQNRGMRDRSAIQ